MRIDSQKLGDAIKERRGSQALSVAAKESGIDSATLSRLERYFPIDISATNYGRLCQWLGVSADTFLVPSASRGRRTMAAEV